MTNIEYKLGEDTNIGKTVELLIDGEVKGWIEISDIIEYVELDKDVRGKGFYKSLIYHALLLTDTDSLMSNNRNDDSNCAWESWIGAELDKKEECYVSIDDNEKGLFFTYQVG